MIDYAPLVEQWLETELAPWAEVLPELIAKGMSLQRYGDLPRWLRALEELPPLQAASVHLDRPRVGASGAQPLDADTAARLRAALGDAVQLGL